MSIAKVEGDEIVIRIPFTVLSCEAEPRGFLVTDPALFAPHVARELADEDVSERPWIEPFVEAAIVRAAEADAPGITWDDASAEAQSLDEADNESK